MDGLFNVILLISSVCWVIESYPKLDDININKGSAVANKNEDLCKNAVTNIEAEVTAHNLVKVKWKIELQGNCQINNLEVRLLEKYSTKCLVLLVLYKRMKISKTVETNNCGNRKDIRVKSLASGEVLQFWPHSSVRVQGVIVTSHGRVNMNDGNYSSSKLIDTLGNTEEAGEWKVKKVGCYDDCATSWGIYRGIRSLTESGKFCKSCRPYGYHYTVGYRLYCSDYPRNNKIYCYARDCKKYKRTGCGHSLKPLEVRSTSHSISGKITHQTWLTGEVLYLIVLHKDKSCIDYILPGISKYDIRKRKFINVYSFIAACSNGRTEKRTFREYTFSNLNPDTKYKVYIIPLHYNYEDMRAAYFHQKTKIAKPGRVTSVTGEAVSSSSLKFSWKAPTKGYVEKYKISMKYNGKTRTTKNKSYKIDNLKECTEYCVTVIAVNDGGSSPVSEVCGKTFERKPASVTKVDVQPASSNIKVSWEAPKIPAGYDEYEIILRENDVIKRNQTVKDKSYTFDNLTECTEYCVTIKTINSCGSSPVSEVVCGKTFARRAGNITLDKIRNGPHLSRNISWSHSTENCVDYYRIIYWPKNKGRDHRREKHTNKTFFYLDDLLPNTSYKIQVEAVLPQTKDKNVVASSSVKLIMKPSFYTGSAQGTKNIPLITVLCVLVAFIAK